MKREFEMESINWFIEGFRKMTGQTVASEEIGYEAVELFQDEIGHEFIPPNHLAKLPDPMLIETMVYGDKGGNEWVAGIVLCGKVEDGLYTFWTKNGESISRQFINEREGEEER
ncbi:hypothetical protein NLX67_03365 [Domibacillus sp. A3M-37]|uniref:hypothetical protein n=1 Tax=Domibacillus sp. A3M-37 TaxID=2962037 RepID=UPI0020B652B9|nr:hypothetical protein [Domibacillus sp. A3M-37]MCP3761430.1 hypothetical protein [Domibacillus sp. A3M-37]